MGNIWIQIYSIKYYKCKVRNLYYLAKLNTRCVAAFWMCPESFILEAGSPVAVVKRMMTSTWTKIWAASHVRMGQILWSVWAWSLIDECYKEHCPYTLSQGCSIGQWAPSAWDDGCDYTCKIRNLADCDPCAPQQGMCWTPHTPQNVAKHVAFTIVDYY